MTKLEKAVKGLELLKQRLILQADVLGYGYHISDIDNALELLKELLKPRVLTLEEMKSLSTANDDALFDKDMTFVWLEAAADGYINITRPTYSFNPEWGNEDDSFYVYYVGTDVGDRLRSCDYSKTWRCWSAQPTDEQREATPWD